MRRKSDSRDKLSVFADLVRRKRMERKFIQARENDLQSLASLVKIERGEDDEKRRKVKKQFVFLCSLSFAFLSSSLGQILPSSSARTFRPIPSPVAGPAGDTPGGGGEDCLLSSLSASSSRTS